MKKDTTLNTSKNESVDDKNKKILSALNKIWNNKKEGEIIFEFNR